MFLAQKWYENIYIAKMLFGACSHGSGEPQAGEAPALVG